MRAFANLPSNLHAFSNTPSLGVLIFLFHHTTFSRHFLILCFILLFSDCFTPSPTCQVKQRERGRGVLPQKGIGEGSRCALRSHFAPAPSSSGLASFVGTGIEPFCLGMVQLPKILLKNITSNFCTHA